MTGGPLLISKRYAPGVGGAIRQLIAMERQLDSAKTYAAINKIIKTAEALKQLLGEVDEVRRRAEWTILCAKQRIGIELAKVPKASGRPAKISAKAGGNKKGRAATGISEGTRSRLGQLTRFSKSELFNRADALWRDGREATLSTVLQEHLHETRSERRRAHELALADKILALPDKKYGVILADPEWKWEAWSEKGLTKTSPGNHYSTSDLEKIKARDVASIAAQDCVLFLWATVPLLPKCCEVMAAWGFTYKSAMFGIKDRPGTGYWFQNLVEIVLVGTRGSIPAPVQGKQPSQVFHFPRGKHSEKPDHIHEVIEALFPTLPKIELNARTTRPGWDGWGRGSADNRKRRGGRLKICGLMADHTIGPGRHAQHSSADRASERKAGLFGKCPR
jgi:N6-adenosine-specific RNA methylase IME4